MGNLDERIVTELRDISRYGFEARWTRYWPLVFEIVESDPESTATVRNAIVEVEERIASSENRPTLDRLLGEQRGVWQEEAESVFYEFIQPFIHGDGTAAEREALYNELQQVKQDVKAKIDATERAKAYPEYVLALDYVVAFAIIASMAFSKADRRAARKRETTVRASEAATARAPVPQPVEETGLQPPADRVADAGRLPTVPPIERSRKHNAGAPRRRKTGLIVTVLTVILLLAAAGATFIMRPDLIDIEQMMAGILEDGSFDTSVDEFMARAASACPLPEGDLTLDDVTTLAPCIDRANTDVVNAFRLLVSGADGTWTQANGLEDWDAPEGESKDKLMLAWEHLRELRETYDDRITQSVVQYDDQFYPPDEERDAQGWRFAVWICTCNELAELVEVGDPARAHRVFISGPELVTTPHTYNTLVSLLRDYFLSGEKLGDPEQVALTVEQFDLPHGLAAGPRLGGPYASRRDTEQAIEDIKSFYESLRFSIIDVDLR